MRLNLHTLMRRRQAGATLIEILVTVVILSFGVLSLAGLQAYSVAASKNAVNRGLAAAMASDLADILRANPAGFAAGNYNKAAAFVATTTAVPTVTVNCNFPSCTVAQLATLDANMFNARLKATLRAGIYAVLQPGGSTTQADIYIMWQEQRAAGATAASEASFDSCPAAIQALDPLPRCYYVRVNL
jgi:type IV pilus assembly protein PilV